MTATWDRHCMTVALQTAQFSSHPNKMGVVIANHNLILATGYNRQILDDVTDESYIIHAEEDAITHAARQGLTVNKTTLYTTAFPCFSCFKLIINAGISHVIYQEACAVDSRVIDAALKLLIPIEQLSLS